MIETHRHDMDAIDRMRSFLRRDGLILGHARGLRWLQNGLSPLMVQRRITRL
jgi:hypothetical protein